MVLPETVERVVVVSGGPSANETYFRSEFQVAVAATKLRWWGAFVTIGVNHVVERDPFTFWATCDHVVFETANPRGQPILFGHNDWHQRITEGPQLDAWRAWPKIFQNDVHHRMPPAAGGVPTHKSAGPPCAHWNKFSGLAALGLAWILRPKEVDLFGFDNEGEGGAADEGHDLPRNRKPERWATEIQIFDWWLGAFSRAHIPVRRHTPDGIEEWPFDWGVA